jgi:dolichyl-phosphooligosaccharide-protein glycotransferase
MLLAKYRNQIIISAFLIGFALFALWLRIIPMLNMGSIDPLTIVGSDDPLYNLRQVEVLIHNGLQYSWFDPMTLYPTGSTMYWGPAFPTIIAIFCMIFGASTRPEIMSIGLLVPPFMAAIMVPIMYFVGKFCGNWKTGICAALFTAVVTGQYFYRSFYGYMDHHIAEVLFSTIFCLMYIYILYKHHEDKINIKDIKSYLNLIILAVITGISYLLGFFTMPTMILFAMMVGIFTVIQFIINNYREKPNEYLLVTNVVTFVTVIIGFLLFGVKAMNMDLANYSIAQLCAYTVLIGVTIILYWMSTWKRYENKRNHRYVIDISLLSLIALIVFYAISPSTFIGFIEGAIGFFGQSSLSNTIQEARAWTPANAWSTFNYGILIMFGGILVLFYRNIKQYKPQELFVLIWSVMILYSTSQHIRYEYYCAINVALLSAICASFIVEIAWKDIGMFIHKVSPDSGMQLVDIVPVKKKKKKDRKITARKSSINYGLIGIAMVVVTLSGLFVYTSAYQSYGVSTYGVIHMNTDWKESLEWMRNNTPDTGVNYLASYPSKNGYVYPNTSYGVMSWWDYGHMITYIANRIPNANPFQQGIRSINGSEVFFISTSEDVSNSVLTNLSTRYVVTDSEMDTGKFWAMTIWYNMTYPAMEYQKPVAVPNKNGGYDTALLNTAAYYHTMISRLHNFDGSMVTPSSVWYVEYNDPSVTGISLPVVTNAAQMDVTNATLRAQIYDSHAPIGSAAGVYSMASVIPTDTVPALQHYRLVHESPTNTLNGGDYDLKYVKVFEYVKGAHINGTGIIEVPIITNTGRIFIYKQESVNGEFIIPYSTTNNPYEVRVADKFKVNGVEVNLQIDEKDVSDYR